MIRSICRALTVAAGFAVIASVAMAGVPDPTKSTTEGSYMLGNARGASPLVVPGAPLSVTDGYTVTVRDVSNNPLQGVTVSFNFPAGTLRAHASQQFGQTSSCGSNTVSRVTDSNGIAILIPAVVGNNDAGVLTQVRANGVLLTSITLRTLDLVCEGSQPGKVSGFDFNNFRQHFNPGQPLFGLPGADFNNAINAGAVVDGFDFNWFRTEFNCGVTTALPPGTICTQTQCSPCP